MNTIDSYHFGQIVINGKSYSSDVIIFPDRIQGTWWRSKSHQLTLADITGVLTENPEVLIVGTGASGQMRVLSEVQQETEARDIELVVQPTSEACDIYNQLSRVQRVVAALHLTC
ncbi:Mth938-like domain-containing protein [Chloroflexota bacterium]